MLYLSRNAKRARSRTRANSSRTATKLLECSSTPPPLAYIVAPVPTSSSSLPPAPTAFPLETTTSTLAPRSYLVLAMLSSTLAPLKVVTQRLPWFVRSAAEGIIGEVSPMG